VDLLDGRLVVEGPGGGKPEVLPGVRWEQLRALLEGLLHLGRVEQADRVMAALADADSLPGEEELRDLGRVAQACGAEDWEARWAPARKPVR
jgi:hypothetical protein